MRVVGKGKRVINVIVNIAKRILKDKRGSVRDNINAIISLIIGVGVATLVLIFVGVLGGQTYSMVQDDISRINDSEVREHVTESVKSGFEALAQTGGYLPLLVLAIMIGIILAIVVSIGRETTERSNKGGGAL